MSEIIIIALVVLLFFGGRKIPELMRGLGKGVRSFKEGMSEVEKELNSDIEPAGKQEYNHGKVKYWDTVDAGKQESYNRQETEEKGS